jgi:hypothetical protein
MKYELIEVLLSGEKERTPELPATQNLPVFVNPTRALTEIVGDLLGAQNIMGTLRFKVRLDRPGWIFHGVLILRTQRPSCKKQALLESRRIVWVLIVGGFGE